MESSLSTSGISHSRRDWPLILLSLACLLAAQWNIRNKPFQKIAEDIQLNGMQEPREQDWPYITQCARYIQRWSTILPTKPTCLMQAVSAKRLLYRHRIGSTIHIGVQKASDSVKGHAWLVCGGQIIVGAAIADDYRTIKTYSDATSASEQQ